MTDGSSTAASLPPTGEPTAPTLDERIETAYGRGDYATVRVLCRELLAQRDLSAVSKSLATDYLKRVSIDPVQVGVLVACFLLFGFIAFKYVPF